MDKISQKEIVFSAIIDTLKENNILFEVGETDFKKILNPKLKTIIRSKVLNFIIASKAPITVTKSEKELAEYSGSVVNNWLLRDDRLNGIMCILNKSNKNNHKYPNDITLIALRNLLKKTTDVSYNIELIKLIEQRIAFLDNQANKR